MKPKNFVSLMGLLVVSSANPALAECPNGFEQLEEYDIQEMSVGWAPVEFYQEPPSYKYWFRYKNPNIKMKDLNKCINIDRPDLHSMRTSFGVNTKGRIQCGDINMSGSAGAGVARIGVMPSSGSNYITFDRIPDVSFSVNDYDFKEDVKRQRQRQKLFYETGQWCNEKRNKCYEETRYRGFYAWAPDGVLNSKRLKTIMSERKYKKVSICKEIKF